MPLQRRPTSKWWYGRWEVDGKTYCKNLGVRIRGRPPARRSDLGDAVFEKAKAQAQAQLDKLVEQSQRRHRTEEILQSLHEIHAGHRPGSVRLQDLPDGWEAIPRRHPPSAGYRAGSRAVLDAFVAHTAHHFPNAVEMADVTPEMAKQFLANERDRGIAPKTWNDELKLLRATFKHLRREAGLIDNPFEGIPLRDLETMSRAPFSVPEMKAVLEACADDDFIRPIIVTGMCTAMRRGDCCRLRWADVDLDEGFITVKTSKTGETVDIPILPLLREELLRLPRSKRKKDSGYCFPEQAAMYDANPSGLTSRVKRVLTRAFAREKPGTPAAPAPSPEIVRERGLAYLDTLPASGKRERMRQAFDFYMSGRSLPEVARATGLSKGCVSGYLHQIAEGVGFPVIRPRADSLGPAERRLLQAERKEGVRRASVRDFHSFRVTWITLALASGVPLELVQRVTGHRTVEVVLKHYFRPGREQLRAAVSHAMPDLFMHAHPPASKP